MSLNDFQIITKLGQGAYSSVYKALRLVDQEFYAIKKVKLSNLSEKERANALNEVRILASFRHPHIVGYKEAFMEEATNSLCIVMEFLDGGDLYKKITEQNKKGQLFQQSYIWTVFLQFIKGLQALHKANILHRDLKVSLHFSKKPNNPLHVVSGFPLPQSANVFLNKQGVTKLGDLNVSKVVKQGFGQTQAGTPYYASPEVWKDEAYNSKSDMWSAGCVLYEMVCLKPPFRAKDMEGLYTKVLKGIYPRIPPHFSSDLAMLIKSLLKQQPEERPSCSEILSLEVCQRKISQVLFLEAEDCVSPLLRTIRATKQLNMITDRLPKPNYSPIKYKERLNSDSVSVSNVPNLKTAGSEQNHSDMVNIPRLKRQLKKKIRETELIKQKLEEMLEAEERKQLPRLRNKSVELGRSEEKDYLQLPKLKMKMRYGY